MDARRQTLRGLLTLAPRPDDQSAFEAAVRDAVALQDDAKGTSSSADNRRGAWEYVLRHEVLTLSATEGEALARAPDAYYAELRYRLDLILAFTELDVCDAPFPFMVLQDLLETQTVGSCAHIFSWIEARAGRLRAGMVPSKGKALVLLRTLNDLLRRLSRAGATTALCGRILTFLSGVFPLGERSGVNLRGEYGPPWEGVHVRKEEDAEMPVEGESKPAAAEKMEVDTPAPAVVPEPKPDDKADLYNTFWALQAPFARPPLLVDSATFATFKDNVAHVLPVISEASSRDRLMMGSKAGANASAAAAAAASRKRKRGEDVGAAAPVPPAPAPGQDYFFAKFLTSPELLELEIADVHFRRQVLVQLLVLLEHLSTFAPDAKAKWATGRNRSLQMDFTLGPDDQTWVKETAGRAVEELRKTAPGGRAFAEAARVTLARERNWVRWKAELCPPFDRHSWAGPAGETRMWDVGAASRAKICQPPASWEYRLGSEPLTEIWDMGFRDLRDLENAFQPGEVRDFAKKAALEDKRIDARTRILQRQAAARAAAAAEATAARAAAQADAPDVEMAVAPPKPAPAPAPATPAPSAAAAAAPASSPPIHPSLPAKPGAAGTSRLAAVATPEPAPAPVTAAPSAPAESPRDREIARLEEAKARWSWLALRAAREGGATLVFGNPKVVDQPGGGVDLDALADAVEERQREGLDPPKPTRPGGGAPDAGADVDGADGTDEGTPPSAGDGKDTEGKDAEGKDAEGKDAEGKDTEIKVEDAELKTEVAKADASMEAEAPTAATGDVKMEDS